MRRPADDEQITQSLQWLVIGLLLLALGIGLGILIATDTDPVDIDALWNNFVASFAPALLPLSLFMNAVGGGVVGTYIVPGAVAVLLVVARRPWSAVYFVAASAVSAALVQVLKATFGRVRPEDMLVISDYGSYPSGHTANAATIAVIAVLLFPRLWVGLSGAAWVVLMAFGRTQVHAHWLSDTIGGALIGVGAALAVGTAFGVRIQRERARTGGLPPARPVDIVVDSTWRAR